MKLFRRERELAALYTERLRLVAMLPEMLDAEARRDATLDRLLQAAVPEAWPPVDLEPHVLLMMQQQARESPEKRGWHRYMVWDGAPGGAVLVGCCGGFPKENGVAEIGYSTLPNYQRRGFATEAAQSLVEYLLQQDGVTAVHAQALADADASLKVMQRAGLSAAGVGDDPGTLRYVRER